MGHVENHDPTSHGITYCVDEPFGSGGVSGTIRFQNHTLYAGGGELMAQCPRTDTGEKVDDHYRCVERIARLDRYGSMCVAQHGFLVEIDAEAYLGQLGIVVALERVEIVGTAFCGAVSTPEVVFK